MIKGCVGDWLGIDKCCFAGENDEPTAEGLILERLMDKF